MNKLGSLRVGDVSSHDFIPDDPQAVATIFVYGPKGACKTTQLIGQEDAERCARQLAERVGISATGGTRDESLSDLTARMRADVAEIDRRMKSGELPSNFMDRESFTSIDDGLTRFEYYAKKADR